jgi:hypothetical protein
MPASLLAWLIEIDDQKPKEAKTKKVKKTKKQKPEKEQKQTEAPVTQYIYPTDEDDVRSILQRLPISFCHDYTKWLCVTNVLHGLGFETLWDTWSQQSTKYDSAKNSVIWRSQKPFLNVNYLIHMLNKSVAKKDALRYISGTIPYQPISSGLTVQTRTLGDDDLLSVKGKKYLNIKAYVKGYNTMIIKSDTGTAKTTSTAEYVASLHDRLRLFRSLVALTSLTSTSRASRTRRSN